MSHIQCFQPIQSIQKSQMAFDKWRQSTFVAHQITAATVTKFIPTIVCVAVPCRCQSYPHAFQTLVTASNATYMSIKTFNLARCLIFMSNKVIFIHCILPHQIQMYGVQKIMNKVCTSVCMYECSMFVCLCVFIANNRRRNEKKKIHTILWVEGREVVKGCGSEERMH